MRQAEGVSVDRPLPASNSRRSALGHQRDRPERADGDLFCEIGVAAAAPDSFGDLIDCAGELDGRPIADLLIDVRPARKTL